MRNKNRKRKIKYKNVLILGVIILLIIISFKNVFKRDNKEELDLNFVGKTYNEVKAYGDKHSLDIDFIYEYNDEIDKDVVIESDANNDKIKAVVSLGKIPLDTYREKGVNELGRVPIMMYHGIIDTVDNKYTGGNVDINGYNRTAKAFREDLEFYYQSGYRMVRLIDYVNGIIDVPLGYSPIILTFDDGNKNNFNVLGKKEDGTLEIDPECAVGILESFKKKYPDFQVTATFFVMTNLFNQQKYNNDILEWLVNNDYDIGNHTTNHANFTEIGTNKTQEVIGKMYQKLDSIIKDKYVKIVALPFGSPYNRNHENYPYILSGKYNDYSYETVSALRVGWESEVSPFNKSFDKTFLKRCRAYDNNGKEFDIEMIFKNLEKSRYISDGDINKIVIRESDESKININIENVIKY